MSMKSALQWISKLDGDEELRKQAKVAGFNARLAVAKEHGFEFTLKEVETVLVGRSTKLSDADLDAVAGGGESTDNQNLEDEWNNMTPDQQAAAYASMAA